MTALREGRMKNLTLSLLLVLTAPEVLGASLKISFEGTSARVSNLSPARPVVLFAVSREFRTGEVTVVPRARIQVSDAKGEAVLDFGRAVSPFTIFAAIELDSGNFAVEEGSSGKSIVTDAVLLRRGKKDKFNELILGGSYLEVLVVRPLGGAWRGAFGDGAPGDKSPRQDGAIAFELETLQAVLVPGPPPPDELNATDVVIIVDPRSMRYIALKGANVRK